MKNADILVKIDGIIIVDDTCLYYNNDMVNHYISSESYIELFLFEQIEWPHRVIRKIKPMKN